MPKVITGLCPLPIKTEVKEILEEQGAPSSVDALIDNVKLKVSDHR